MLTSHDETRSLSRGRPRAHRGLPALWLVALGFVLLSVSPARGQIPNTQAPPLMNRDLDQAPLRDTLPAEIQDIPRVSAELEVIHRRSQLIVAKTNIVRAAIADPAIVDVVQYSPNEVAVVGMALGSTTLTLWFENNPQPLIYLITVIRDPSLEHQRRIDYGKLEKKIALLFPNSKVYLIPLSGKIIVKGQARDSEEASWILSIIRSETINQMGSLGGAQPPSNPGLPPLGINPANMAASNIVNMLQIPGNFQLMLRVRIVEIDRARARQMGVDWAALISGGRDVFTQSLAGTPSTLSGIIENGQVTFALNWLESNQVSRILTEPTLTVLSGHPATILSGGEFAVPTIVGINGVGGQQTYFRGFGTTLIVIPVVLDKDLIRMNIRPEFSQIDSSLTSQGGIPGLDTRRVQTTVELREGQSIVLGGLIGTQTKSGIDNIPFFSSIPLIGPLIFASKQDSQEETELLITVAPEIVRPLDPDEVPPYPGFEVTVPNDWLFYGKAFLQGPPDTSVNQLAPYGHNSGVGVPIGYGQFNPAPASPLYSPVPTATNRGVSGAIGNANPNGPASGGPPPVTGRYPVQQSPGGQGNAYPGLSNGFSPAMSGGVGAYSQYPTMPNGGPGDPGTIYQLPGQPPAGGGNYPQYPAMQNGGPAPSGTMYQSPGQPPNGTIQAPPDRGIRTIPQMLRSRFQRNTAPPADGYSSSMGASNNGAN